MIGSVRDDARAIGLATLAFGLMAPPPMLRHGWEREPVVGRRKVGRNRARRDKRNAIAAASRKRNR